MTRTRSPRQSAAGHHVRATVSVETIAAETGSSVRSVRRVIRELTAIGVLSHAGPDAFVIHLDVLAAMPRIDEVGGA